MRTHVVPLARLGGWLAAMQARGVLVDPKVLAGAHLLREEMDEGIYE